MPLVEPQHLLKALELQPRMSEISRVRIGEVCEDALLFNVPDTQ